MIKKIPLITVLLGCHLAQAVEFNFEMLQGKARAFAEEIYDKEIIPQERIEKTLSFCLLNGEPYEDRDLYLTQKSAPRLCEEKEYLTKTFKQIGCFFRTCLEIYNKPDLKESKKIALSILLEMVTERLDYRLWHIEIRRKALEELKEEEQKKTQDTTMPLISSKANQPLVNNTDKSRSQDLIVK
ncbi:hypothetical protein [Candidatus Odyssella thessalonicensis]|uniref:hypothetical protein n=1 Tax=Candidatus Odyssella thessalonicensis TaxID=84647 RepID=UPI000225ACCA|nr:hypothetical protein [Candidatus Odyssella thessalonicensis]